MKEVIHLNKINKAVSLLLCVSLLFAFAPLSGLTNEAHAADGDKAWIKTYGGTGYEEFHSVLETSDGGFVAFGHSMSSNQDWAHNNYGEYDGIMAKFDAAGELTWVKNYGGSGVEYFLDAAETSDGGYVAVGETMSTDNHLESTSPQGSNDFLITKLDADGNIVWIKTFGGSRTDKFRSVQETADGGFIAAGYTQSSGIDVTPNSEGANANDYDEDFVIAKFKANGVKEWIKSYGGSHTDQLESIRETGDGGFVAVGYTLSTDGDLHLNTNTGFPDYNAVLARFDVNGEMVWLDTYGGTGSDYFYSVRDIDDGGFVAVGSSQSSDGDFPSNGSLDAVIAKINESGELTWSKTYGGTDMEDLHSVEETPSGEWLVAGVSGSNFGGLQNKGNMDFFIAKLDASGNEIWLRSYGGGMHDYIYAAQLTSDNGVVAVGYTQSNDGDIASHKGGRDVAILKLQGPDSTPPGEVSTLGETHDGVSAALTWTNPDDGDFSHVKIYRDGVLVGDHVTIASFGETGLTSETTYTYKVTTVDLSGNESTGSTISVTTDDITPPAKPTGLAAAAADAQVDLSWSANVEGDLAGYNIYRSLDNTTFQKINTSLVPTVTYSNTGLANATTYFYKITAVDASNNGSTETTSVSATPQDTTAPATPSGLAASAGNSQVTLSWSPNPEGDLAGYHIYVNGIKNNGGTVTGATYSVTGLTNGQTYHFAISAEDVNGNESSASAAVSAAPDGTAPAEISGLRETHDDNSVTLSWTNPVDSGFSHVHVYRDGVTVTSSVYETYRDTGLMDETAYSYTITTVDRAGNESAGTTITVETSDITAPGMPGGLSSAVGNGEVTLSWNPNTELDLAGYHVYVDGVRSNGSVVPGTSYTVSGLTNEQSYSFEVSAVDTSGNESPHSAPVSETPDGTAPPEVTGLSESHDETSVTLFWSNPAGGGFEHVYVYRDGVTVTSSVYETYRDTGLSEGTSYSYKIATVDSLGNESAGVTISVTTNETPEADDTDNAENDRQKTDAEKNQQITKQLLSLPASEAAQSGSAGDITRLIGRDLPITSAILTEDGTLAELPDMTVDVNGKLKVEGLPPGEYRMLLQVIAPSGESLAGNEAVLTVDADGGASVEAELIDPYGVATDPITHEVLSGADMRLYWADTELNRSQGRVPHTLVELPELPDFAPNRNHNPQITNEAGEYGWMVYANGDYYFTAEKEEYELFDSRNDQRNEQHGATSYIRDGIIHVGDTIVKMDFHMNSKVVSEGEHVSYMNGYPDGTFRPESSLTRGEVAAIFSRIAARVEDDQVEVNYSDVDPSHWYNSAVEKVSMQGLMQGYPDGTFRPKEHVTRAEFAVLVSRYKHLSGDTISSYGDAATHWAGVEIARVTEAHWFEGYSDRTFKPDQQITRMEAVTVLNKMLERRLGAVPKSSPWPDVPSDVWGYADIMEASNHHRFEQLFNGYEVWGSDSELQN